MSWVIYDFAHMFICLLWFCHRLLKGEIVRTYVIHLLGTYVTILWNWLILSQNALYLYFDRSRMYLILQETLFQDQVLKPYKSVQDSSWKVSVIKARQQAIYQAWRAFPTLWLDNISTDRVSIEIYEKQNFRYVLTLICAYVFRLSFSQP